MNERTLAALAGALFLYVLLMRTYDVASTFLMLGEQTRDWMVALGSITDLPLTGAPSTAGGRGLGPVYYWLLWIGRVAIGPFMDNLPHAGGVIVALLQSIADVFLFIALSRRVHWALALAMCLLVASAPFDIAISQVIWNPPVSAALDQVSDGDGAAADAGLSAVAGRVDGDVRVDGGASATSRRCLSPHRSSPRLAIAAVLRTFDGRSTVVLRSTARSPAPDRCDNSRSAGSIRHFSLSRAVGAGGADRG